MNRRGQPLAPRLPRLRVCFRGGDADERPGGIFAFGFDHAVIERLKAKIPPAHRSWDGAAKLWWVSDANEAELRELFPDFELYTKQGAFF